MVVTTETLAIEVTSKKPTAVEQQQQQERQKQQRPWQQQGPKERKWQQKHCAESTATAEGPEHYGNNIKRDASK